MMTNGRLFEDTRKAADNSSSTYYLDIALQALEETLAEYYSQEWPFAVGEGAVATIAPYLTGTITLTNNLTSVAGASTVWDVNWPVPAILRPANSSAEPLVVTAFNGATSLTIDKGYPFTTAAGVTYTLEFPTYPVSEYIAISGVMIGQSGWRAPLRINSLQEILYRRTQWTPGAYPCEFFLIPGDGTTSAKLVLNPAPSQVQTIRFRYARATPEFRCLVAGGDYGGTASIAAAGTTVTGVGTTFQKLGYSLVGHYFEDPNQSDIYTLISAVGSDTSLTVGAWGGTAVSASSFYVSPKILMPDDFRPMLRNLMLWKYFQNSKELELAKAAEERYLRNYQLAWRRVNRMRQNRDVKPIDIGGFLCEVEPPAMPWQLVMTYAP